MQAITDMKNSINKLTSSLSIQEKGKFPAQPQPNPKGQFEVSNSSNPQGEHIKSITTLRSGKIINKDTPKKVNKPEESLKLKSDDELDNSKSDVALHDPIPAPFFQRLQPPQKMV